MAEKIGVVAFGYGVPSTLRVNQLIAFMASKEAREGGGDVYTQADVCVDSDIKAEYIPEEPGQPPPTLRIARGAVAWAVRKGYDTLYVACARPHLWRCERDLTYAIAEAGAKIRVEVCSLVYAYEEDWWFCKESTQPRVRSRREWEKRENIVKRMPMFVYKRVAK